MPEPVPSTNSSPAEVLDIILDKGLIIPESAEVCCPTCNPYVFASVETFLKFAEAVNCGTPGTCTCCSRVNASVETYLKYAEAVGNEIESCENNEAFMDCLEEIQNQLSLPEINILLDKGIVEYGSLGTPASTQLCLINTFALSAFNIQTGNTSTYFEIITRILDKGIVIDCTGTETIIASVETYLKWAEAVG
jgi:hypothetical protein